MKLFKFLLFLFSMTAFSQEIIKLPLPKTKGEKSLEELLFSRRSRRKYKKTPLKLEEVSQILWAAYGITASWGGKTTPSAGALYPLKIYLVVGNVLNLERGIYQYQPQKHCLIKISSQDRREQLYESALRQEWVKKAAVDIIACADFSKTTKRYGERGKRYIYMEAGHSAQNIYLEAEALNLATVVVGAFDDEKVKEALKVKSVPLYIMPIGRRKDGAF